MDSRLDQYFLLLNRESKRGFAPPLPQTWYLVDLVTCSFRRTAIEGWSCTTIPTDTFMERYSNLPWHLCACGLFWNGFCRQIMTNTEVTINPLTPNDLYMSRTAPLTSKRCILYFYSTNRGTEYFKHALYSPFFSSSKCSLFHNANLFGSFIIHILYKGCAEIKKTLFRRQRVNVPIKSQTKFKRLKY